LPSSLAVAWTRPCDDATRREAMMKTLANERAVSKGKRISLIEFGLSIKKSNPGRILNRNRFEFYAKAQVEGYWHYLQVSRNMRAARQIANSQVPLLCFHPLAFAENSLRFWS